MAGYPAYAAANNAYPPPPYNNAAPQMARQASHYNDPGQAQQLQVQPQMAYPTPAGSFPQQELNRNSPQQSPPQQQYMLQQQQLLKHPSQSNQVQFALPQQSNPQQYFVPPQQNVPQYAVQQQQQQQQQEYVVQQQQYASLGQTNGHNSAAVYNLPSGYTRSKSLVSNQAPFYHDGGEDVIHTGGNDMPKPSYGFCCSQGKRSENEDRLFARPRLTTGLSYVAAFGVFDGHGGSHAAEFCTDYVPKYLEYAIQKSVKEPTAIKKLLQNCFREADQEFIKRAGTIPTHDLTSISHSLEAKHIQTSGCTACVILTVGKTIYCANAGDSRAILYNSQKDSIVDLSDVHKPSDPQEQQRIIAAGGKVSMSGGCARINNILGTSRGIGDTYLKHCVIPDPAIASHELRQGDDFLIIATDGLWDVFSTSAVCTIALEAGEAKLAAKALAEKAIQNGSEDNVSVVVVDLRTTYLWTSPTLVPDIPPAPAPHQHHTPYIVEKPKQEEVRYEVPRAAPPQENSCCVCM